LDELVGSKIGEELIKNEYIKCMPVNFIRGLTFRDSLVIVDEAQNLDHKELTTILTRFGENSKFVIIGDSFQADIGNKSGFSKIRQAFDDEESEKNGIHSFIFTENEIVRSEILKFIIKKLEKVN
jgi:predicted ribonuclease YlaK